MKTRASSALALIGTLLVAGCSTDTTTEPTASADSTPHLIAAGQVFDPVAHDVEDPEQACGNDPGRTELEQFDRAAWPDIELEEGVGIMTCGNAQGAGFRHIADGHVDDFGEIADLVGSSWEDVAWFAIDVALEEPSEVYLYRDDIVNYLVELHYVDSVGDIQSSWTVVVGVGLESDQIITSFPRD